MVDHFFFPFLSSLSVLLALGIVSACPLCPLIPEGEVESLGCAVPVEIQLDRSPVTIVDHSFNISYVQAVLLLHVQGRFGSIEEFDLSQSEHFLYEGDSNVTVPHHLGLQWHRHRLRKRPHTILPIVLRIDHEIAVNLSGVVLEINSLKHLQCREPVAIEAKVALDLRIRAGRERTRRPVTKSTVITRRPLSIVRISSPTQDNSTDLSSSRDLPAPVVCDIPFNISYTVRSHSGDLADIDLQTQFIADGNDTFSVFLLFYETCTDCDKDCILNGSNAYEIRYCVPGGTTKNCKDASDHTNIRRVLTERICLGFALCGLLERAELDLSGDISSHYKALQVPAHRIAKINPPFRSLGYTMRTYIGYGILLTILFIFTFFSALSRCRYGQDLAQDSRERDGWEIDEADVQLCTDRRLAAGENTSVYMGLLTTTEASTHEHSVLLGTYNKVAVRVLHRASPMCVRRRFLYEIRVMKLLGNHPRIVQMIGAVTLSEPACIVLHFYSSGHLLDYLRERSCYMLKMRALGIDLESCSSIDLDYFIAVQDLFRWAIEIAAGMEYICSRGIVHRNLCARNIYVDETRGVRIGGFEAARTESSDDSAVRHGSLSIKWLAPEALRFLAFSTASDIWSFGVVLYELFTLGAPPYPFIHSALIHAYLLKGNRLPRPSQASLQMYAVMSSCWRYVPSQRPSFSALRHSLHALALADAEDAESPFYVKVSDDAYFDVSDKFSEETEQKNLSVIMEDDEILTIRDEKRFGGD